MILAGFLLALFSVAVLPLPIPLLLPGMLLLLAAFTHAWRHHHALDGHPIRVRLDSEGHWHWQQGGLSEPVELLDDSYHVPYLVILNFRRYGARRTACSLLLTTDNIDAETFRRLRVHLNWLERRAERLGDNGVERG